MTYLTVEEAAIEFRCNVDTVRRKAAEGSIPARKVGRRWLFHPDMIDKYMRGEWQSTNVRPGAPGGLDSLYAASLFADPPEPRIGRRQKSLKPPSAPATGGKRN